MNKTKNFKGQWFIISAVVASGVFLVISSLFQGYFAVDPDRVAQINEDFYFNNIKYELEKLDAIKDCGTFDRQFNEFTHLVKSRLAGAGYYVFVNKTTGCAPSSITTFGILAASEKAVIYENVNLADFYAVKV